MNDVTKYQILLINRINYRINKWNKRTGVSEKEIYLFLRNIIEAAHVINVIELSKLASDKLHYVSEDSMREWSTGKWKAFLKEILVYTEQNFVINELETSEYIHKEDNIILLIDDDFDFIKHIKSTLEENGYHVIIALDAEKGLDVFYTVKPLFVLLDINLKNSKELYDLKQIMEVAQSIFTPIVLTSGINIVENRIAAYSIGASDFISKPINLDVFMPYLKNRIEFTQRILESITIDELTKTYNRKHMNNMLNVAIEKFKQSNMVFSLAMIDLDHFKKVNDQYGHIIGDQVLETLTTMMKENIKERNSIFRYGGEEFIIYFPEKKAVDVSTIMERFRKAFNAHIFSVQDHLFHVTFSAGILEIDDTYDTIEEVIESVDKALYVSKEGGRNRTTIYSRQSTPLYYKVLNVIIVDDDRLIRTMLSDAFNEWKLDKDTTIIVHTYSDGQEFLASSWYDPNEKHLILLDGVMPKMDGVEILSKVRNSYPEENIVISMLTSRSGEENIVQALIKGADDYMLKTFNVKEIIARCETLVRKMNL